MSLEGGHESLAVSSKAHQTFWPLAAAVDRRPFDTQDRSLDQTGRECLWPAGVCFRGESRPGKQVFPGTVGLSARAVSLPVQWFADPSGWKR